LVDEFYGAVWIVLASELASWGRDQLAATPSGLKSIPRISRQLCRCPSRESWRCAAPMSVLSVALCSTPG
jgi:hypothetical protein